MNMNIPEQAKMINNCCCWAEKKLFLPFRKFPKFVGKIDTFFLRLTQHPICVVIFYFRGRPRIDLLSTFSCLFGVSAEQLCVCVYIYSYTYTCVYRYIGYVVVRKMASLSFLFTAYVPFFSHIQGRFGHGSNILEIPEMKDAQMQIRDVYWGPKNSTIYFWAK